MDIIEPLQSQQKRPLLRESGRGFVCGNFLQRKSGSEEPQFYMQPCTRLCTSLPRVTERVNSEQANLRHISGLTQCCFRQDLTRFARAYCVGPTPQHHFSRAGRKRNALDREFNLVVADYKLQGAANSPSSMANFSWRREGDSNPRYAINVYPLSRRAP